ncbi:MAG: alpha/beta hydrolase [Solirubrobacteraceae bacterium]|nr:alpha/beta hydrolase [Solirubrobacteraceae bacterium]
MTLNHVRSGSGEPLLLIHGIGHSHRAWVPVTDGLVENGFDVVAIDAPGFGESDPLPPGTRPNVAALAVAIAAFCDELGWEQPHIAGNSMGGALALELAKMGRASSATGLSPAGFWNHRELRFCQASLGASYRLIRGAGGTLDALADHASARGMLAGQLMARPWRMPPDEMRHTLHGLAGSEAFPATLEAFDDLVPPTQAEVAGVSVTIAWAARDRLLLPRQAHRARMRYPSGHHVLLRGVGHVPTWDDPELVVRTIATGARTPRPTAQAAAGTGPNA